MDLHLFGWFCKYQLLSLTQLRAEYPRGVNVTNWGVTATKPGGKSSIRPMPCMHDPMLALASTCKHLQAHINKIAISCE